jgi:hypothetical protein
MSDKLFTLPIVDFGGKESYAIINPKQVTVLEPDSETIGEETLSAKTITGTRIVVHGEVYFVPMKPELLARAIGYEVIEVATATNA